MNKIFIILIFIYFLPFRGSSQLLLTGRSYTGNKYLTNPANAGLYSRPQLFFSYRKIASNFEGVPQLVNFGVSSPIYKNMSLGGRFFKQSEGLFNTFITYIDYSYYLKITDNQNIRFGLGGGINSNKLNYSGIVADDPTAIIDVASKSFEGTYFESSAGIAYQWNNLEFSFAIPKLFESKKNIGLSYISELRYNFNLKESNIILTPGFFVNYFPNSPGFYDFSVQATWQRKFWTAIAYTNRPGLVVSAGINLKNIGIAYAAELSTSRYSNIFNQIHEISISYAFAKRVKQPKDTLIGPINNLYVENDTLHTDSAKAIPNKIETTKITGNKDSINELHPKTGYDIVEVGEGIYIIKSMLADSSNSNHKNIVTTDNKKISEMDSSLANMLLNRIDSEKQDEDYEWIEIGPGIYTLKQNNLDSVNTDSNITIDEHVLDSLIFRRSELRKNSQNNKQEQINDKLKKKYYSLILYINASNINLLSNAEIAEKTWVYTDAQGNTNYYFGSFESEQEANLYIKKLSKYHNLKTELKQFIEE